MAALARCDPSEKQPFKENAMQRYIKTTLAALFATSMAAGAFAQAESTQNSGDKGPSIEDRQNLDTGTTGSINQGSLMTDQDLGSWESGNVNVVQLSSLRDDDPNRTFLEDRMNASPDEVAALQSSIDSNAALKSQLEAQNVQLNNIVAAEKAADGSVTFYVK
jgi:hypothetical protein